MSRKVWKKQQVSTAIGTTLGGSKAPAPLCQKEPVVMIVDSEDVSWVPLFGDSPGTVS